MKKILLMILACLFVISLAGCQYLVPPIVKAGGTEIIKDTDTTTPAKVVTPNTFEVEITPPSKEKTQPDADDERWFIPKREIRR